MKITISNEEFNAYINIASKVASAFGTNLDISKEDAIMAIPGVVNVYDEGDAIAVDYDANSIAGTLNIISKYVPPIVSAAKTIYEVGKMCNDDINDFVENVVADNTPDDDAPADTESDVETTEANPLEESHDDTSTIEGTSDAIDNGVTTNKSYDFSNPDPESTTFTPND